LEEAEFKNIIIIGLGEIGSRHLQALTKCNFLVNISCVDPSYESIEIAKSRVFSSSSDNVSSLNYYQSFEDIPKKIDLAIIATNAKIRLEALKSLVNRSKVKNILFEKVLFQKITEFEEASSILKVNGINSWVNCPRRVWPLYKEVRSYLEHKEDILFELKGGMWGMGCNSIHFIDIFEWLTSSKISVVDTEALDSQILESKRPGFKEFGGTLEVKFTRNNTLLLKSYLKEERASIIEISGKGFKLTIDEISGTLISEEGGRIKSKNFPIPYQSHLSNLVAEDILMNNRTALPSFSESSRQHIPMLSSFQKHVENITGTKIDYCPIT